MSAVLTKRSRVVRSQGCELMHSNSWSIRGHQVTRDQFLHRLISEPPSDTAGTNSLQMVSSSRILTTIEIKDESFCEFQFHRKSFVRKSLEIASNMLRRIRRLGGRKFTSIVLGTRDRGIVWARPYSRYRSVSSLECPFLGRCQLLVPVLRNYGSAVKTASFAPFTSRPVKRAFSWYTLSRERLSRTPPADIKLARKRLKEMLDDQ